MNKTATILAGLVLSTAASFAGPPPPMPPGPPPPLPTDRCAEGISYNTVELLYANTDSDLGVGGLGVFGGDGDADGVRLNFEFSPVEHFYVRLGTGYDEADYWDAWHVSAGIGGYIALTDNIHLAADGGIIWAEFDEQFWTVEDPVVNPLGGYWSNYSDDDTGWYVRPHVRAKWGCLEVHAGVAYTDMFDDEDWAFFAKAYYQVWGGWDIAVGYNEGEMDADAETWTIGARWKY